MSTAPTAAPPAVTAAEKAAMFGAALVIGILLATPVTRGAVADSVVTVAHFIADTFMNTARAVVGMFGWLA